MARLKKSSPSALDFATDDESNRLQHISRTTTRRKPALRTSPRKKAVKSYEHEEILSDEEEDSHSGLQPKSTPKASVPRKQVRLAPLQAASLSRLSPLEPSLRLGVDIPPRKCNKSLFTRKPTLKANKSATIAPLPTSLEPEEAEKDEVVEVEVEESIWRESDASTESEDELPSPRKLLSRPFLPKPVKSSQGIPVLEESEDLVRRLEKIDLTGDRDSAFSFSLHDTAKYQSRPVSSSDKENNNAILHFTPPKLYSPPKSKERPVTPPQSPSKSRLQSPSKTKVRVPSAQLRQSLDAFWDAERVNDWHDQYSPQKVLKSPRKLKLFKNDNSTSPTASPRKAPSPSKKTKAERQAIQSFADQKHDLASTFLAELDATITGGKIETLAASTGGVRIIWSKTLNSTAGRANWRRETSKIRNLDGTITTTHKHHASIELAEKVINDEHRLLNVIAHEFCHLANFMVSGFKDQPHGASFKAWGKQCSKAFADKGVEVTTKHSYQIEYKYIWQCSNENCGSEFKRHSKSIDPKRHTCGSCREALIQIKPVPRKDAGAAVGGYAAYVKENFAAVKKIMPGAKQKEVMEAVGRKWRAEKAAGGQGRSLPSGMAAGQMSRGSSAEGRDELGGLVSAVEVITLDDD